jgi:hypothetical protein
VLAPLAGVDAAAGLEHPDVPPGLNARTRYENVVFARALRSA